jgi:hypothetical protein
MVSRKSTKKTYLVIFFAVAVVILLGLFFYFYSGVYEGASFTPTPKPSEYELFLKKLINLIENNDPIIQPYNVCLPNIKNCLADFNKSSKINSNYYSYDGLINDIFKYNFNVENISNFLNVPSTNYTCPNSLDNDLSNKLFQSVVKNLTNKNDLNQINNNLLKLLNPKHPGKNIKIHDHYASLLTGNSSSIKQLIVPIDNYISESNIEFTTKDKYLLFVNQLIYIVKFLIEVNKKISFGDFVKKTNIQILPILQINIIKRKLTL